MHGKALRFEWMDDVLSESPLSFWEYHHVHSWNPIPPGQGSYIPDAIVTLGQWGPTRLPGGAGIWTGVCGTH